MQLVVAHLIDRHLLHVSHILDVCLGHYRHDGDVGEVRPQRIGECPCDCNLRSSSVLILKMNLQVCLVRREDEVIDIARFSEFNGGCGVVCSEKVYHLLLDVL